MKPWGNNNHTQFVHVRYQNFANSSIIATTVSIARLQDYNMALRANEPNDSASAPLPGVHYFWQNVEKPPATELSQWIELKGLFELATLASDITKTTTKHDPQIPALVGSMSKATATKNIVSLQK